MSEVCEYTTEDLGHLGLVSGMCSELKIAETIDRLLPKSGKHVSHGKAVCAMVLNGLGFVNQQLYLLPEFFRNKPVERLLGPGIKAEELNDDSLGRTLDALYEADPTAVYSSVSAKACQVLRLKPRFSHMDSTSVHVDGTYNSKMPYEEGVIKLTPGYSRDHRPGHNQCVLNLIAESQASIPIHMSAASGNSEDKKGFRKLVAAHAGELQDVHDFIYLVADSALYTKATLKEMPEGLMFISRVPATLSLTKVLLENADVSRMQQIDENYSFQQAWGEYGGMMQRFIIIYSRHKFKRDSQSLKRRSLKAGERECKSFAKLCRRPFACREDAMKEWEKFRKELCYTRVYDLEVREVFRYGKRGKPKNGEQAARLEYFLTGCMASCLDKHEQLLSTQGMFILATNELDTKRLPAPEVLSAYKGQSRVEKGFRFLKSPEFLASSLYLKKPERIMALLMVMTICLMVYAALEYRTRQGLKQQGVTFPSQTGKPTDKPTARWLFHCFTGIHILYHNGKFMGIMNLNEDHWIIINLLGYQTFYS